MIFDTLNYSRIDKYIYIYIKIILNNNVEKN